MADYPEVVYWLTLINQSGLKLNLIKPIIQRWCITERRPLADLFGFSPLEWATTFGLGDAEADQAAAAAGKLAQQAQILAQWQAQGIETLSRMDPRYPKRLIYALPPAKQPLLMWARGAVELLNESLVAILGDDVPDETMFEFVDDLMQTLVAEEIGLVSGYGRGLDRTTFEKMLQTEGGRAVVMLPMGLSAFAKTTTRLEAAIAAEKIVIASPFAPDTPYQERLAEARNLLIDYLALTLLILNTDDEAATRAKAALDRAAPVFVSLDDTAGNRALIDQGALLLTDAGEVVEMVQQAVIDTTLMESAETEEEPLASAAPVLEGPPPVVELDPNDDYSLRSEEVEPIDTEEALEILSLGGDVPDLLRQRLKKKAKEDEVE